MPIAIEVELVTCGELTHAGQVFVGCIYTNRRNALDDSNLQCDELLLLLLLSHFPRGGLDLDVWCA